MRNPWLFLLLSTGACRPPLPDPEGGDGYIRGRFHTLLGAGLENVEICLQEPNDLCTSTNSSGQFILEGLPDAQNVTVFLDREGLFPTALHHYTADLEPPWDKTLLSQGTMQTVANRVDETLEPRMGHMSFMVHQAHFREGKVAQTSGISFRIEPEQGSSLYYLNTLQLPNPELSETTGAGGGGALNIPPGAYELVLENTGGPCERIIGWDFPTGTRIPFAIYEGRSTYFDVLCPQQD